MKTNCVSKFFTSSVFLSDNQCPKYPNFCKLTKMSDNSNNVHFSGIRFICSPYLAIKLALASLGPIMSRCGPQMNLTPSKLTLLLYHLSLLQVESPHFTSH